MKTTLYRRSFQFRFEARTSRGSLFEKLSWFIRFEKEGKVGWGECGPLKGLSVDDLPEREFEDKLRYFIGQVERTSSIETYLKDEEEWEGYPSMHFGFETAWLDWKNGGNKQLLQNDFSLGKKPLPINGLVWMGDVAFMQAQIEEKLSQDFSCIKMKVGSLDFEEECKLLAFIRERFSPNQITLRVDANGAFSPEEAFNKLEVLSQFGLHSIEQPIHAGQFNQMAKLCKESPIPIALDEELIGVYPEQSQVDLLDRIKPQFIILKPSLVGGLEASSRWIRLAEERNIGWWMTSALESNIGLNAISQFTAEYSVTLPQGLGTGQLYHNNFSSPLTISKGQIFYDLGKDWKIDL